MPAKPPTSWYAKICSVCGADISRSKRIRDPLGNYYCPGCYPVQPRANSTEVEAGDSPQYCCYACEGWFDVTDLYRETDGRTICKKCWKAQFAPPPSLAALEQLMPVPVDPWPQPAGPAELPEGLALARPEPAQLPEGLELVNPEPAKLPDGLELVESQAPPIDQVHDKVQCDGCYALCEMDEMTVGADGTHLCRACMEREDNQALWL